MPIAALSENAARAICSSLVLNDAISVTKELIDNALDSNATNIVIEISANTLDIIQVKDNGAGVGVEDRQLLCKRGYTSKIRTYEDLTQLGGTFLGFRGEALASIAELSENLTFTTRIDGETVGTLLKYDSNAKLISSSSAAHGTGTTVRVSGFLKTIPVRKQTALKHAAKTLGNIKRLLFDYAFARPTVRFQLKILKSGSDLKANWSFAPCTDTNNLNLLASKIVGKDVASQCKQANVTSDNGSTALDALLFHKDADIAKCAGADCFISIDGRPLTVERGLMKELNKTYKSYISHILPESSTIPKKIFLLLRLQCPKGSYDVNIEPAKNEVMFEDSKLVPDLFVRLCNNTYGEKKVQPVSPKPATKSHADVLANFDLLLAKKPPQTVQETSQVGSVTHVRNTKASEKSSSPAALQDVTSRLKGKETLRNMTHPDEQYLLDPQSEGIELPEKGSERGLELDETEDLMDAQVHNPFVLAKMNTRLKPQDLSAHSSHISSSPDTGTAQGAGTEQEFISGSRNRRLLLPSPSPSPTRGESYQNPGPPNRPWKTRQTQREGDRDEVPSPAPTEKLSQRPKPTLIDEWTKSINSPSPLQGTTRLAPTHGTQSPRLDTGSNLESTDVERSLLSPSKRQSGPRPTHLPAFRSPFKKNTNAQSTSPTKEGNPRSGTIALADTYAENSSSAPSTQPGESQSPGVEKPNVLSTTELDEIMDFEHRKRSTILQHRGQTRTRKVNEADSVNESMDKDQTFTVPARPENEGLTPTDSATKYASKFGPDKNGDAISVPPQPSSASYTQNPHWNRYKKALRDLDERASKRPTTSRLAEAEGQPELVGNKDGDMTDQGREEAKLSSKDPRAYLIRHANDTGYEGKEGTAGKSKRSLTAKLPFETIVPEVATFVYHGIIHSSTSCDLQQVSYQTEALKAIDPYVCNGKICLGLSNRDLPPNVVQEYETQLRRLLGATSPVQAEESQA